MRPDAIKRVGIVIESWKRDVFKRRLDEGKYSYEEFPRLMEGTLLLRVTTDSVAKLSDLCEAAMKECRGLH